MSDGDDSRGGDGRGDDGSATGEGDTDVLAADADDLAGIVDLFDALTPAELQKALAELAFKRGVDTPPDAVVENALASYHLVEHDGLLVVGPTAFPTLPENAVDLPHILDVAHEPPPTEAVAETAERRFREEAARALGADGEGGDEGESTVERLVDVSYDLEAWGPVDVREVRQRLDAARDE